MKSGRRLIHWTLIGTLVAGLVLAGCTGKGAVNGSGDTGAGGDRDAALDTGSPSESGISTCTPGRMVTCSCTASTQGVQVCQSDGTWGACECDGYSTDVGVDAGGGDGDADSSEPKACCAFEDLENADSVSCRGMQFDRILNVVDDLGADPDGNDNIDSILEDDLADNTLLVFPEGTYLSGDLSLDGNDIGLIAQPGASVTIVPDEPKDQMGETLWSYSDAGGLLLQGLEFDYTQDGYGNRLNITPSGDFTICDIHLRGEFPDDTKGFRLDVRDEDSEGLIRRAVMTGGPEETTYDWNGIYVGKEHSGTVTIKDCTVANGSNNGVYASSPGGPGGGDGPVKVIGGTYQNNNIAGVRIGSTDSVVRGVDVIVDSQVPKHNGRNARGIRVRDKRGQVVENCDIYYSEDATGGSGGVAIHKETGHVTVRDVRIRMDKDGMAAVRGKSPNVGGDVGMTLEDVSITGSAADDSTVDISDRPDSEIKNSCIQQTGADRDGIELSRSGGSRVTDTRIEVTGSTVVGSNVSTSNIDETADCESPDIDGIQ